MQLRFLLFCLTLSISGVLSAQDKPKSSQPQASDIFTPMQDTLSAQKVFTVVEQMPRFKSPFCETILTKTERDQCAQQMMLEYIYQNITYPEAAVKKGIEGTAVVRFTVSETGKIENAQVLRPLGGGCDEEAKRVVESMPDWIPARQKGENVAVFFNLPIKFKLEPQAKDKKKKRKNGKE